MVIVYIFGKEILNFVLHIDVMDIFCICVFLLHVPHMHHILCIENEVRLRHMPPWLLNALHEWIKLLTYRRVDSWLIFLALNFINIRAGMITRMEYIMLELSVLVESWFSIYTVLLQRATEVIQYHRWRLAHVAVHSLACVFASFWSIYNMATITMAMFCTEERKEVGAPYSWSNAIVFFAVGHNRHIIVHWLRFLVLFFLVLFKIPRRPKLRPLICKVVKPSGLWWVVQTNNLRTFRFYIVVVCL